MVGDKPYYQFAVEVFRREGGLCCHTEKRFKELCVFARGGLCLGHVECDLHEDGVLLFGRQRVTKCLVHNCNDDQDHKHTGNNNASNRSGFRATLHALERRARAEERGKTLGAELSCVSQATHPAGLPGAGIVDKAGLEGGGVGFKGKETWYWCYVVLRCPLLRAILVDGRGTGQDG